MVNKRDSSGCRGGLIPPLPTPYPSTSRRVQQRLQFQSRLTVDLANQVIPALNEMAVSLSHSSSSPSSAEPSSGFIAAASSILSSFNANARQQPLQPSTIDRCHARLYEACARFRRRSRGDRSIVIDDQSSLNDLDKFDHNINDHGYSSPAPARLIRAMDVSLPSQAGTADLLSVLPPHLAAIYRTPSLLLHRPAVKLAAKKAFMCSSSEYITLLKRMREKNMISFTDSPLAVNGLFGVDKGENELRLIIDARPVNSMFVDSPPVSLPTPELVTQFNLAEGETLYAAKVDLDNFYHRIRLPPEWWPYFALPPIRAGDLGIARFRPDAIVYPCCTTLPMGFSHSVFLAQSAHEHIIDTKVPLLRRCDRIVRSNAIVDPLTCDAVVVEGQRLPLCTSTLPVPVGDFKLDRIRHSVYIDDLNLYGLDPSAMGAAMDQYLAAVDAEHLPAKAKKVVRPTADGLECLGVFVDGRSAEVGMAVPKLQVLRASTMRLLDIGECTGRELAHIVGRWTWAMLIRRPAMAVFSAVYRFINCAGGARYQLWPSVRRELRTVSRLAPLLFASIRCEWAPVVVASDASELAAGVVYVDTPTHMVESLAALPSRPGVEPPQSIRSFVADSEWKTAVSHRWRDIEHINALEVRAALTAVKWSMKRPDVLQPDSIDHRRLLLLCDSSAAMGSMNKGRSSAHRLLRPLRSISTLLLASGVYLRVMWLPSALNPADGPSRL